MPLSRLNFFCEAGECLNLLWSRSPTRFIEIELIQKIEKDYDAEPSRIFAGHSFGGLFAPHTSLSSMISSTHCHVAVY
jgi:hypothetical protein